MRFKLFTNFFPYSSHYVQIISNTFRIFFEQFWNCVRILFRVVFWCYTRNAKYLTFRKEYLQSINRIGKMLHLKILNCSNILQTQRYILKKDFMFYFKYFVLLSNFLQSSKYTLHCLHFHCIKRMVILPTTLHKFPYCLTLNSTTDFKFI